MRTGEREPERGKSACRARGVRDRMAGWARAVRRDVAVVYFAARDPRVPWHVKLLAAAVAAYALSPIDLIPDFIPVLGYIDDLVIVPLGLLLALRLIPRDVLSDLRARAAEGASLPMSRAAAGAIILLWLAGIAALAAWLWR